MKMQVENKKCEYIKYIYVYLKEKEHKSKISLPFALQDGGLW